MHQPHSVFLINSSADFINRIKSISGLQDRVISLCLAMLSGLLFYGLSDAWPSSPDGWQHHFPRIHALADALRAGVIYPRWFPDLTSGYGEPVLNYYSPGFYYPPALLFLAGFDMVMCARLSLAVGFALSAQWMFHLARLYVSLWPAVVGVVCFQFFPYHLIDFFARSAFPEFVAFVWLPLIAFYTIRAATEQSRANNRTNAESEGGASHLSFLIKAGLAWAGLILTHNLTALMAALVLGVALVLLILLQHGGRAGVLLMSGTSVAALVIGMLISAWYILPALSELGWTLTGHGALSKIYQDHLYSWTELFDLHFVYPYSSQHQFILPFYVIPIVIAAPLAAVFRQSRPFRLFTLVTLLLTLGAVGMTTDASAWLWASGELLLEKLQFPWRWHMFTAFGAALLLAACLESLRGLRRLPAFAMPLLGVLLSAYLVASALVRLDYPAGDYNSYEDISMTLKGHIQMLFSDGSTGRDFMPVWTSESLEESGYEPWAASPNLNALDSVSVVPTRTGLLQKQFQVTSQQPFQLLFHQFYFPAWRVTVDGVQVETLPASNLALISGLVPSGTHTVELEWGATRAVWFGRALTAIGWVVVFVLLSKAVKLSPTHASGRDNDLHVAPVPKNWNVGPFLPPLFLRYGPLAIWFAVGAFMVVAASGTAVRTWDITAIGADYGGIRLEGIQSTPPTRAGDVAPVHLTWFIKDYPEPMTAFVHLVDEAGNKVAQQDVPPGGAYYTPVPLWAPGLVLHSIHDLTIPASLPPGQYRLLAGLYYRDYPHESLVPLHSDSSRLEIGMVEVLPR